jgi:cation:H+ antiporter
LDIFLLICGVAGLWLGTELTVGGALAIAKRHQLSEFFVGLVILSFGSDLPELAVAVDAGLKSLGGVNASGVVVGSAIGSVMGQMGFVLGVAGLISFLVLPRSYIFRHGSMLLAATLALFIVAFDGVVTRAEGLGLIGFYAAYVVLLMRRAQVPEDTPAALNRGGRRSWAALIVGLAVVIGSSELTVSSVISLATRFGISDALISVLVIGIGTSLPELSISISAILKKKTELSVGNIIGSNILDTLLPIGVAALISPVWFEREFLVFDIPYIFVLTFITLAFFVRVRGLQKFEAGIILGLYLLYVYLKLQ